MAFSLPYIFYYFFVFFSFLVSKCNREFNIYSKLFFLFFSFFFIGLRGYLQADWLIYYPVWESAPVLHDGVNTLITYLQTSLYEFGFSFFLILCKSIINNYLFVQIVIYAINIVVLHFFFETYISKYYLFAFCFYFLFGGYILSIILIRNCISVMIFLCSLKYLHAKKFFPFFCINLFGLLFHSSSIFYLIIYFFLRFRYNSILLLFLFFTGNCMFLMQIPIATFIVNVISIFLFGRYADLVSSYLLSETYSVAYGISIGYIERFFSFCFIFYNRKIIYKSGLLIFANFLFIFVLIYLWFSDFRIVVDRIPLLISCCYWILYPFMYSQFSKKNKMVFLILLFIYSTLKIFIMFDEPIAKYENILFPHMDYLERKNYTLQVVK